MPAPPRSKRNGDGFELCIRDYFEALIAADRFWARKSCCKVRWKPKYYSRDRQAHITFDVSIEIYLPGAEEFSSVVLIECKNYSHSVPVDDIEEFFAKVQQVAAANAKAILASTASFQRGTREVAKSKGIGLLRYFAQDNCKWELKRAPSTTARSLFPDDAHLIENGLALQDFVSPVFDLYMQSPTRLTNSLWDFVEDLVLSANLPPAKIQRLLNPLSKHANGVPFIEKDALEAQAAELLSLVSYSGAELNLEDLCAYECDRTGLIVKTTVVTTSDQESSVVLGRITFDPLVIEVFRQAEPHCARERFTLAHELSHHFLSHGEYLVREYCDDSDFTLHRRAAVDGIDIARMEFQANFLASCLLMPRQYFLDDFRAVTKRLDLPNRGFGALYVDDQPCNLHSLNLITTDLAGRYSVSRAAVRIRLETLGLMRERPSLSHVTSALGSADLFSNHQQKLGGEEGMGR